MANRYLKPVQKLLNIYRFLVNYSVKVDARQFTFIVILMGTVGLAQSGLLAIITMAIDQVPDPALWLLYAFVGLALFVPGARYVSGVMLERIVRNATFSLRLRMGRRVLDLPIRKQEQIGESKLLATLIDDTNRIIESFVQLPGFFMNMAIIVGVLSYLCWLSWQMFLVLLATIVVAVVAYEVPVIRAHALDRQVREHWEGVMAHFQGIVRGGKEMKLHRGRRHAYWEEDMYAEADELREKRIQSQLIHIAGSRIISLCTNVFMGIVLFGLPFYSGADTQLVTGYALGVLYLRNPINGLVAFLPMLSRSHVAVQKVEDLGLMDQNLLTETTLSREMNPSPVRTIEFRDVTFQYEAENASEAFEVGPFNLTLDSGSLIFITGGNGSGKTTLMKLLIGLYPPTSGRIFLNGTSVTEDALGDYRQHFSTVFTDFHIFDALYGIDTEGREEDVERYLKRLELDHKLDINDGVLSTTDLSKGQRKRLALLTAYLEERPCYVFDEWAADQDPDFKEVFYRELLPELKRQNKMVIIISHDDHYYDVADRVIKLTNGVVTEDTTDDLSRVSPAYSSGK